MQTATNIIDYLKLWEEFSPVAKAAIQSEADRGIFTFGWVFTYWKGQKVVEGQKITLEDADAMLAERVDFYRRELFYKGMPKNTSLQIQDALVSLVHNNGINGFPILFKEVCLQDELAYLQFYDDIFADKIPIKGLFYRRACDAEIFRNGHYEKREFIYGPERENFEFALSQNPEGLKMLDEVELFSDNFN